MAKSLPPLGWFRTFESAARHLNFSAAADELGMTQSAVSQQIRSMEIRLGTQLFIRKARGLALTDDGRKLLPMVGNAIEKLNSAARLFDAGPTHDLLTIATSVSVSQWIVFPRIQEFKKQYPDIRIRIMNTIWPDEFNASIADVEIRFGSEKQVGKGAKRLGPDGLIAVASPTIKKMHEDSILIEAVGTSNGWQEWGEKEQISYPLNSSLYVDSYGAALDLAQQGCGIALTSSLLARPLIKKGAIHQIGQTELQGNEGYFLATVSNSQIAMKFNQWLENILAET